MSSKTRTSLSDDEILVGSKVYSAEKLMSFHPGGPLFIAAFSGRDASKAFLSYHRKPFPHQRVKFALERDEGSDSNKYYDDQKVDADYLELVDRVEKVVPRKDSFAPWHYFIKALLIMAVCVYLEGYMHWTGRYRWYTSALLGLFWAYLGLNIQHDANHGSVSPRSWLNRLFGLTQHWYGGSCASWIHQHVVQHHIHTNDVHLDPDIEGKLVVRLNPLKPLLAVHAFQWVYFFALICLYGFSVVQFSLTTVLQGFYFTPFSKQLNKWRPYELPWSIFFYLRFFVIPYVWAPSLYTFLHTAPALVVMGFYLSVFFHISHNFEGVRHVEETNDSKASWLYYQVVTSSNVGGKWLCMINGGLNYQIEHHLFPRMHHSHYPKVAPVVRQFCAEKGIPYTHFESISDNLSSCLNHMHDIGTNSVPKTAKELRSLAVNRDKNTRHG